MPTPKSNCARALPQIQSPRSFSAPDLCRCGKIKLNGYVISMRMKTEMKQKKVAAKAVPTIVVAMPKYNAD